LLLLIHSFLFSLFPFYIPCCNKMSSDGSSQSIFISFGTSSLVS
jgi:hypothetical protein